eukprot:9754191-Alexandrium_andersonii.AAC.1
MPDVAGCVTGGLEADRRLPPARAKEERAPCQRLGHVEEGAATRRNFPPPQGSGQCQACSKRGVILINQGRPAGSGARC